MNATSGGCPGVRIDPPGAFASDGLGNRDRHRLGGLPFEESAVRRSISVEYAPGIRLRTCTAEDLIVMKAFADRPQDRIDLRGILVRQGTGNLDWSYIWENLTPLAEIKESPGIPDHLKMLVAEVRPGEES